MQMIYQIQSYTNGDWMTFACADRFSIAWEIVDGQQEKYINTPELKFRIKNSITEEISVV
jgi:hypothetical protein